MSEKKFVYKGVTLENFEEQAIFSHSEILNMITKGKVEGSQRIDYSKALAKLNVKDLNEEQFDKVSAWHSVVSMNYQICNGGIIHYFDTGYHNYNAPFNEEDVARVSKREQTEMLKEILAFGKEIYGGQGVSYEEKLDDLQNMINFFEKADYKEQVPVYETVYCEEDEEVWDEETQEWVSNPDYREPEEEIVGYENQIVFEDGYDRSDEFDRLYYSINDFLETLLEGYAQYLYKDISKALEKKPSLDEQVQDVKETCVYNLLKEAEERRINMRDNER